MTITEIITNLELIETYLDKEVDSENPVQLTSKLNDISSLIGLSAKCVAESKQIKAEATKTFVMNLIDKKGHETHTPTLIKILQESATLKEQYVVDFSERINRGLTHCIEALRSMISLYKSELENSLRKS